MINQTINISWGLNQPPFSVCELNQAQMLQGVEAIPKNAYYILLLGLACLLFYFFVQPYLSKSINESVTNRIGVLGVCLVFLASWGLFLFVFKLGEGELRSVLRVAGFIIPLLLILLGYAAYRRFKE